MNKAITEQMLQMSHEIDHLRKRFATQQTIFLVLFAIVVAVLCTGSASHDGHFNRVFTQSMIIQNTNGDPVVQLYNTEDGSSLLICDSSGREAIHLISGSERNDVLINDKNSENIAVAIQGMSDRGHISVLRTFQNIYAAKESLSKPPESYLSGSKKEEVIVPVLRLPEINN